MGAFCSLNAQAQNIQVKGNLVDGTGEPLIGATVKLKGNASVGAVTDFDGNFSISVPSENSILVFTYVGMKTKEVKIGKKREFKLSMEDDNAIGEVVVVGYGQQKKASVVGSITQTTGEVLERAAGVSDVGSALTGNLPGVVTIQGNGMPGEEEPQIIIRGSSSWNNSDPLVLVDGIERPLSSVDISSVESISVLKDASATAVYGVKGANGVILVTTKRGQEGKTKISGSTSWGILTPTKMVEQANSYEYATFHNMMRQNSHGKNGDPLSPQFSDVVIQKFKDGSDPVRFPSTLWAEYIMKDATMQSKHNLNISGGTKTARYFINVGYYTQGGLFKEFGQDYDFGYQYNSFNYRANLDLDVTKTTTISFNLAGKVDNANKPYSGQGSSGLINEAYQATPFSSPGIINGRYIATETQYEDCGTDQLPFVGGSGITYFGNNDVNGGFMKTTNNKLQFDLQLKQKLDMITKGLSFKMKASYNGAYAIKKNAYAKKATYTPVLQDDGTYKYKKYTCWRN